MPHLEPAIESAVKWVNPEVQYGKNTVPIGPIKWERNADGSMTAVAIGTEKGQPRQRPIFTIPSPANAKPKEPIVNTPIDEAELALTTVGTATQPPDVATAVDAETPPSDSPATASTPKSEPQGAPSTLGTQSLPIRTATTSSSTEQASSNPEQGPGYVEKAKEVVDQASAAVTATVESTTSTVAGLATGSKEKVEEKAPEKTPEQKETEAKIDGTPAPAIEGFLREKTASM